MKTWYGHNPIAVLANIWLAVPMVALNWLIIGKINGNLELVLFLAGATWWFFPHALYLFCEIKHLLFKDGIADDLPPGGVLLFSVQSAFGLVCSILATLFVAMLLTVIMPLPFGIFLVSVIMSLGAVLGLHDITALEAWSHPLYVIRLIKWLLQSPIDRALILELALLNSLLCLAFQLAYLS